jgi:hypothetical protein
MDMLCSVTLGSGIKVDKMSGGKESRGQEEETRETRRKKQKSFIFFLFSVLTTFFLIFIHSYRKRYSRKKKTMYDPNPSEWFGLVIFLLTGLIAFFSFALSAIAGKWRILSSNGLLPSSFYSFLFSTFYLFSVISISVATWLVWADSVRCVDPALAPRNSSACPVPTLLNVTMILYTVYIVLIVIFPPFLFSFPSWRLLPFVISFAIFGLSFSLTTTVFNLWLLPGLLSFFGSLVLTLQFVWMYGYWRRSTILLNVGKGKGGIYQTPFHKTRVVGVR